MIIPKKIKIGNLTYIIKISNKREEQDVMGSTYIKTQDIIISRNIKREKQEETFFHEIIHAILEDMRERELGDNEKFVHGMARILYQSLKDSNLLR